MLSELEEKEAAQECALIEQSNEQSRALVRWFIPIIDDFLFSDHAFNLIYFRIALNRTRRRGEYRREGCKNETATFRSARGCG